MQYMGGKRRIAEWVADVVNSHRSGRLFEPFCGGLGATVALQPAEAADIQLPLISLYNAIRDGWNPPQHVSEWEYQRARGLPPWNPLHGFCGYGLSFGGKYFGGYARGEEGRSYAANASRGLIRDIGALKETTFHCRPYWDTPAARGDTIYCDPPYYETQGYDGAGGFDHSRFWAWARDMAAAGVTVLVSEYSAPDWDEIELVDSVDRGMALRRRHGHLTRQEGMFLIRPHPVRKRVRHPKG